jgi:hypothetical protein
VPAVERFPPPVVASRGRGGGQGATFADGQARMYGVNRSGATARFVRRSLDGTVIDERTLESHAMISR